jgi:hypothetical protein
VSELYRISQSHLEDTFSLLRECGNGRRECQVLWLSPWAAPSTITTLVHPDHRATAISFDLKDAWITAFWKRLAEENRGVRVQVHTHPDSAFHSGTDDHWPIVQTPGFLSLVIPRFALGDVGLDDAYLAELDDLCRWREVEVHARIEMIS